MYKKFKLDRLIVGQTFLLLAISLGVLFYFSHKVLMKEAMRDARLTLEATAQTIDNILMSVEQSTGNIYYDVLEHMDDPDRMYVYCRELVESNPNIVGCAIAFKPGYYPGKDLFMAYVHRRAFTNDIKSDLVTTNSFTERPYTEQFWFTAPMNDGWFGWTDPLKGDDTENEPLVSFCLPLNDKSGERVGVIAVDVSISKLSKILSEVKPSERGYSLILAKSGSLIVHPDMDMLKSKSILTKMVEGADHTYHDAIEAMLSGQSGMKKFYMNGESWSVFYKPFKRVEWEGRSDWQLDWSVGVVYPDSDIHRAHNQQLFLVVGIAVVGLLVFFLSCSWFIRRELKPLRLLTKTAQSIADGNYDDPLPAVSREDEIGQLQNRFRMMQKELEKQTAEFENQEQQLQAQSEQLRASYDRIEESDKMKTSFLHYITNQMALPAETIDRSVTTLCNNYQDLSKDEIDNQVDSIERKSEALVELLNHMAHFTDNETGKEDSHD